jgi:hypothetical protein
MTRCTTFTTSRRRQDDELSGSPRDRDITVDRALDTLVERLGVDEDDQIELETLRRLRGQRPSRSAAESASEWSGGVFPCPVPSRLACAAGRPAFLIEAGRQVGDGPLEARRDGGEVELWLRPASLGGDLGIAASPPERYESRVERRGYVFPLSRQNRASVWCASASAAHAIATESRPFCSSTFRWCPRSRIHAT